MSAAIQTLQISRGLPLALELDLCSDDFGAVAVDLTGCTVAAAIRTAEGDLPKVDLDCAVTDSAGGKVAVSLDDAMTALLTLDPHIWDLVVTDSAGVPVPVLTGRVEISDNAVA